MTAEQQTDALSRLMRKLGLEDPEDEELLLMEDELTDAESELLLYLHMDTLEERFLSKLVELAALYYQRDSKELSGVPLQSYSYSEGQISQSEQYLTPSEFRAGVTELLDSLARYRRVPC